jgi:hypothetical protein
MVKKPSKSSLTTMRTVELADFLRQHCKAVGSEAIYEDGWNDKRVAEEMGVQSWTVRNLRTSLLGTLRRGAGVTGDEAFLADLERRVSELEEWRDSQKQRTSAA